jgi:hypothetical protein
LCMPPRSTARSKRWHDNPCPISPASSLLPPCVWASSSPERTGGVSPSSPPPSATFPPLPPPVPLGSCPYFSLSFPHWPPLLLTTESQVQISSGQSPSPPHVKHLSLLPDDGQVNRHIEAIKYGLDCAPRWKRAAGWRTMTDSLRLGVLDGPPRRLRYRDLRSIVRPANVCVLSLFFICLMFPSFPYIDLLMLLSDVPPGQAGVVA